MEPRALIDILAVAGRLRDTPRHCYTEKGRRESVAEHSWRTALMAYLLREEFPEADMQKVQLMCLLHDLGEAFTGDIPVFEKTDADEEAEAGLLADWIRTLPAPYAEEMTALFAEMDARETVEARIFKSLDGLEALIAHNESDLKTWLPLEYDLQMTYAVDRVAFSPYLRALREEIKQDSLRKIDTEAD